VLAVALNFHVCNWLELLEGADATELSAENEERRTDTHLAGTSFFGTESGSGLRSSVFGRNVFVWRHMRAWLFSLTLSMSHVSAPENEEQRRDPIPPFACSRPIVDAKWLDRPRQVGTSGKTVKPKVYLALGISGSFQHLGGIKGNPFLLAINKNPKAPIFQAATVGVVADLMELLPVLTEKIKQSR